MLSQRVDEEGNVLEGEGLVNGLAPEDSFNDGYNRGFQMALYGFGKMCGAYTSCEDCPLKKVAGDIDCKEFLYKHPEKVQKVLEDFIDEPVTYLAEFALRFPNNFMPFELLAMSCCRKAIFEGTVECDHAGDENPEACMKCWCEPYAGDIQLDENGEIMENGRPKKDDFDIDIEKSLGYK